MRDFLPAIEAVIKETIFAAINARGAISTRTCFRVGANTPIAANATPIEPKLANPMQNLPFNTKNQTIELRYRIAHRLI